MPPWRPFFTYHCGMRARIVGSGRPGGGCGGSGARMQRTNGPARGSRRGWSTRRGGCSRSRAASRRPATHTPAQSISDPTFAAAYVGRGYAYLEHENLYNALEDFDKAIELDAGLSEAYNYRGVVSLGMADPEQAMLDFSKAIEIAPDFADAYVNRARLHFSRRDFASAIEDMTAAIREEPDETQHYLDRAQMYLLNNDAAGAAADLDQVLSLTDDPNLELAAKRMLAQIRGGVGDDRPDRH